MTRFFCVIIVILTTSICTLSAAEPFAESVLRNLLLRIKSQPQEKVYLQTDREHYVAGEKIWFRAYLSDASTNKPSPHSHYVYVELVDRKNNVCQRVKIRGVDSVYSGYMPVHRIQQQGEYFLRAYSYCMQNTGEDYIFKKKIRIVNTRNSNVRTTTKYSYGKDTVLEIQFTDRQKNVYSNVTVEYIIHTKSRVQQTDSNGILRIPQKEWEEYIDIWYRLKHLVPEKFQEETHASITLTTKRRAVIVRFKNDIPFEFERELFLPEQKRDFDVQFFPEGGDLIAGSMQTVAFKAIRSDGFAEEIEGCVYNEQGKYIATIRSIHKGMGEFDFKPKAGQRYHAVVTSTDSMQKKIDLPLPKREGIALKVWTKDSTLNYSVLIGDSVQIPDSLYLTALSRGVPLSCTPVMKRVGRLPLKMLPEGIIQLALVDSNYEVYSQRLCFVKKQNRKELSLVSDKESYVIRDLVRMTVEVPGEPGKELNGSFSVSVTDDVQCERDSTNENHILSYLLLTSDLKGYIEDPAFYFRDSNCNTDQKLDLLMLTQGWSRFDLPKVIRGELPELPYYLEKGQAISGKVRNLDGKGIKDAEVNIATLSGNVWTTQTDSTGHFVLDGITFPNNTQFIAQTPPKKGLQVVKIFVDPDVFFIPMIQYPYNFDKIEEEENFYKKFIKDYYYENGIKVYTLGEVLVRRRSKKNYSRFDKKASYILDSAQIASMAGWDIRQVLEQIPGVWVDEDHFWIRRDHSPLLPVVDDKLELFHFIMGLRPSDLVRISYLDEAHSKNQFGGNAPYGALIFSTNSKYVRIYRGVQHNVSIRAFLGYQKKAEFYTPRYDVDSVRQALVKETDDRSTIYWNPNIRTNQSGKAEFSFYTSDSYGPYTVTVEGVLDDGTVYRKERKVAITLQKTEKLK